MALKKDRETMEYKYMEALKPTEPKPMGSETEWHIQY